MAVCSVLLESHFSKLDLQLDYSQNTPDSIIYKSVNPLKNTPIFDKRLRPIDFCTTKKTLSVPFYFFFFFYFILPSLGYLSNLNGIFSSFFFHSSLTFLVPCDIQNVPHNLCKPMYVRTFFFLLIKNDLIWLITSNSSRWRGYVCSNAFNLGMTVDLFVILTGLTLSFFSSFFFSSSHFFLLNFIDQPDVFNESVWKL